MKQNSNFADTGTRQSVSPAVFPAVSPAARSCGWAAALTASMATFLGGCQTAPAPRVDFGPPPQESLTQVAPGVSRCQRELSRIIASGKPISASDGVSYDEAWRLMASYVLKRSDLSILSLNTGLANNATDYSTIRDAQLFNQLGLMLESDAASLGAVSVNRVDVSALGMLSLDDATLMRRCVEGEALARQFSSFLGQTDGDRAGKDARFVQKLAGIVAADIALASKPGNIPGAAVRARLQEDVMALEWMRVCAAVKFTEIHPTAKSLISNYSSQAATAIQSDFATFNLVWAGMLPHATQSVWNSSPATDKIGTWALVRAIERTAWTGASAAPAVSPSAESEQINKNFGDSR